MPHCTSIPKTLVEAVRYFEDEDVALAFVANIRWPKGEQVCPKCGSVGEHYFLKNQRRWKCRDCRKQFSIKVGTVFEDSPLPLSKWLPAVWLLANCKNGVSSYELARAIDVTQKTAWYMLHRIRLAMEDGNGIGGQMEGEVEADETYVGGLAKNMHEARRERVITGTGGHNKTAVLGILHRGEDGNRVRARVIKKPDKEAVQQEIRKHVRRGSSVYTDRHWAYRGLDADYLHEAIDHVKAYVRGRVHTNGLESFWSLLKRAVRGTYVSIDPFHLFRYVDEQAFRFNHRQQSDAERFMAMLSSVVGKRLTYTSLTGAELCQT